MLLLLSHILPLAQYLSFVSLTLIASRSGQEMLNLGSPKLFNLETGRQTWEHQCSGDSCTKGGLQQNQHLSGVWKVVGVFSPSRQARPSSMCIVVLRGSGIFLAPGFTTRWLLLDHSSDLFWFKRDRERSWDPSRDPARLG